VQEGTEDAQEGTEDVQEGRSEAHSSPLRSLYPITDNDLAPADVFSSSLQSASAGRILQG
jgi:hypothetical protein